MQRATLLTAGPSYASAHVPAPATKQTTGWHSSFPAFVLTSVRPETAQINVGAEPGSQFVGWTGAHCTGLSTECTVQNLAGDFDREIAVEPRFDLVAGR